jgi:septation ring formation regulator EzrA|nr:MAG TPA: hemolysin [Caudoviricetes sp.]
MEATIVVAILSLIGTLGGAYLAGRKTTALVVYRLSELEKKVDKHNHVVERMYEVEKKLALIKDHQQEIMERVENLEKDDHAALNK